MGQDHREKLDSSRNLASRIVQSLRQREMAADFPEVLLHRNRSEVLHHDETEYWDFKERLELDNPLGVARLVSRN
jgi:hypothetical protein